MKKQLIKVFYYFCAISLLASCIKSLVEGNIPLAAICAAGTIGWIYVISTIDE